MTPAEFLNLVCKPNVLAFREEPTSINKAWSAIVALGHFADYFAESQGIEVAEARHRIAKEFPRFNLITDISIASKHVEVRRKPSKRIGLSVRHQRIGKGAAFSDGSYFSDGTSFAEHSDVVRVDFGQEHVDLVELCCSCLTTLDTQIV